MVVELKPHQAQAVEDMSNGKVLVGGVGSGKTPTSLAYFFTKVMGGVLNDPGSIQHPMDLYIFTTARKRGSLDWQRWGAEFYISRERNASVGGIKMTVDSYNNITKYKDIKNAFIILDEQRMVGSGAWTKAFLTIAKSNQWIMLSATPADKWEDYIPLFVANEFYKNRSEFKRLHCVYSYYGRFPKLERYLGVSKLERLRDDILVDMPYEKHTTRHIHEIVVDYDKELFDKVVKKRWHVYENRPLRDVSELFSVMRKVVNSDTSRLEALCTLMESHPRVIVFYNFDYELELLRTLTKDVEPKKTESTSEPMKMDQSSGISPSTYQCTHETISECKMRKTFPDQDLVSGSTDAQLIIPSSSCQTGIFDAQTAEFVRTRLTTENGNTNVPFTEDIKLPSKTVENPHHVPIVEIEQIQQPVDITSSEHFSMGTGDASVATQSLNGAGCITDTLYIKSSTTGSNGTIKENNEPLDGLKSGFTDAQDLTMRSQFCQPSMRDVTIAEWNGHKHEPVPTSDRWVYLVQYVAGAEAWNCTETDTVVFYSLTYSYKIFEQAQGRIDRLDTSFSDLHYFVLKSSSFIDKAVSRALRMKKSFNERDFVKQW